MTEWGVVLVIVTLLGFVSGIITPLIKLNTAIVKLIDSVNALDKSLGDLIESNTKTHKRIWDKLDEHDDKLSRHDTRLAVIEEKEKER